MVFDSRESMVESGTKYVLPELEVRPKYLTGPQRGVQQRAGWIAWLASPILGPSEETVTVPTDVPGQVTVTSVDRRSLEQLAHEYGVETKGLNAQQIIEKMLDASRSLQLDAIFKEGKLEFENRGQFACIVNGLRAAGASITDSEAFDVWYLRQMEQTPPLRIDIQELLNHFRGSQWLPLRESTPPIVCEILGAMQQPDVLVPINLALVEAGLKALPPGYYDVDSIGTVLCRLEADHFDRLWSVLTRQELRENPLVKAAKEQLQPFHDRMERELASQETWKQFGLGAFYIPQEQPPIAEESMVSVSDPDREKATYEASMSLMKDLSDDCAAKSDSDASDLAVRRFRTVLYKAADAHPLVLDLIDHGFSIPLIEVGKEGEEPLRAWAKSIVAQNQGSSKALLLAVHTFIHTNPGVDQAVVDLADSLEKEATIAATHGIVELFTSIADRLSLPKEPNIVLLMKSLDTLDQRKVEDEFVREISKFGLKDLADLLRFICIAEGAGSGVLRLRKFIEDTLFTALQEPEVSQSEYVEIVEDILGIGDLRAVIPMPDRESISKQDSLEEILITYVDRIVELNQERLPQLLRALAPCLDRSRQLPLMARWVAETVDARVSAVIKDDMRSVFEGLCLDEGISEADFGTMVEKFDRRVSTRDDEFREALRDRTVDELFALFAVITTDRASATHILRKILQEIQQKLTEQDVSQLFTLQLFSLLDSLPVDESLQPQWNEIRQQMVEKELAAALPRLGIERTDVYGPLTPAKVAAAIRERKELSIDDALGVISKLSLDGYVSCDQIAVELKKPAAARSDAVEAARDRLRMMGCTVPIKDPAESAEELATRTIERMVQEKNYQALYAITWQLSNQEMRKFSGETAAFLEMVRFKASTFLNEEADVLLKKFDSLTSVQEQGQKNALRSEYEQVLHDRGFGFLHHFIAYALARGYEEKKNYDDAWIATTNVVKSYSPADIGIDAAALLVVAEGMETPTPIRVAMRNAVKSLFIQQMFIMAPKGIEVPPFPEDGNVQKFTEELVRLNPTKLNHIRSWIVFVNKRREPGLFYSDLSRSFTIAARKWFEKNIHEKFVAALSSTQGEERLLLPSQIETQPRKFVLELLRMNGDEEQKGQPIALHSIDAVVHAVEQAMKTTNEALLNELKRRGEEYGYNLKEVVALWKKLRAGERLEGEEGTIEYALTEFWDSDWMADFEAALQWHESVLAQVRARRDYRIRQEIEATVEALRRQGIAIDPIFRRTGRYDEDMRSIAKALISLNEAHIDSVVAQVRRLKETGGLPSLHEIPGDKLESEQAEAKRNIVRFTALVGALEHELAERKRNVEQFNTLLRGQGLAIPDLPDIPNFSEVALTLIQKNPSVAPRDFSAMVKAIDHPLQSTMVAFFERYAKIATMKTLLEAKGWTVPSPLYLHSEQGFVFGVLLENLTRLGELQTFFETLSTEDFPELAEMKASAKVIIQQEMESLGLAPVTTTTVAAVEETENVPTYKPEELASLEVHFGDDGTMCTCNEVANTWMKIFTRGGPGSTTLKEVFAHEKTFAPGERVMLEQSGERFIYFLTTDGKMYIQVDQPGELLKDSLKARGLTILASGSLRVGTEGRPQFLSVVHGQQQGRTGIDAVRNFLKSKKTPVDQCNFAYFDERGRLKLLKGKE